DWTTPENMRLELFLFRPRFEFVESSKNPFLHAFRHRRHDIILVVKRQVVKNILALQIHPPHAFMNNDRKLIRESRIISKQRREGARKYQAVAILMLQSLSVEGGASRSCAQ